MVVLLALPVYKFEGDIFETQKFFNFAFKHLWALGVIGSMLSFLLAKDILRILYKIVPKSEPMDTGRRDFFKNSFLLGAGGCSVVSSALGFHEAQNPEIKTIKVLFSKLPPVFDGFKIVQITDLHVGPLIKKEFVMNVVEKVNKQEPDLIAVTGDLIDGRVKKLSKEVAPLKALKAKHGVFYVTGNHEYYWGLDEWLAHIESELQMQILHNENIILERFNQRFVVAGVHDYRMGKKSSLGSDPFKAKEGTVKEDFTILLAHQPRSCYEAQEAGFDYMICGHTHGGQYLPFAWLVYPFQPYIKGLYNHKGMQLYVSAGCGFWGPPNRFGIKGEITAHILRSKEAKV